MRLAIAFWIGIPLMWTCWWLYEIGLAAMRAWCWAETKLKELK